MNPEIKRYLENPDLIDGPTFVKLMEEFGIKRQDLGIRSRNYIYMLRRGDRRPSRELIMKLIHLIEGRIRVVAPGGGFEPPTTGLTAPRSTG